MMRPAQAATSDLAPLLYRARWIRFSISGEVRSRREQAGFDEHDEVSGTLAAEPGGRYRADLADEDGDRVLDICDWQSRTVPFPELFIPAWLLAEYDLEITGETEYLGRPAYAIVASPRRASRPGTGWLAARVSALVDAELGILLRYEKTGQEAETAQFTSLSVTTAEPADPALLTQPPAADLTDEQVNLLYGSGARTPRVSAQLHEWADQKTMMRLGEAALSATDLGRRTRWLWQAAADSPPQNADLSAHLTVAMPDCYRIEAITDPERQPACISCDGARLWRVYADRIAVRPAEPLPAEIAPIIDPAWLLHGYQLSADGNATFAGRPALRVVAVAPAVLRHGPLSGTPVAVDKIEAFIDAELGVVLHQVCYCQGCPVLRTELSGITPGADPAAFRIEPPPGIRVITGGLLAESGLSIGGMGWMAAKGTSKLAIDICRRWARKPRP
jgi:outer membrane lipoprotein-sorting protein